MVCSVPQALGPSGSVYKKNKSSLVKSLIMNTVLSLLMKIYGNVCRSEVVERVRVMVVDRELDS